MKNIYEGWKTTILGLLLLASAFCYIHLNAMPDYLLVGLLLAVGGALLFAPDDLIKQLKRFLKNKANEKDNDYRY
jgi:hypothetical protein